MAETTPTEKTVVVNSNHLCRLWTLTSISLALNVLILVLLVVGCIIHHHHKLQKHHGGFGGGRGGEGHCCMAGHEGCGHGFHHFHGGFGGGSCMKHGGFGQKRGGFGGGKMGRGEMHGGFGKEHHGDMMGGGMMGRGKNGPPDPAKITDAILNHLSAKLTLTEDEKAKIKPIILDQITQAQKDMEATRQTHEKAMQDTRDKIKALLTPDQQKLLDAMPKPGQKPADQAK